VTGGRRIGAGPDGDGLWFDGQAAADVGLETSLALANDLVIDPQPEAEAALRRILAVDPPTLEALGAGDIPAFVRLGRSLEKIAADIVDGELDRAAWAVNALLAEHSAHPHLAKQDGRWRLHHHPPDARPVPMWTAITADALARLLGSDHSDRIGRCGADGCLLLFLDRSKNSSRRFCSTTCQNRVKAAAFRSRRRAADA
jgi:hypothetical protein